MVYESHLRMGLKSQLLPFLLCGHMGFSGEHVSNYEGEKTLQMIPSIPTSIVLCLSGVGVSEIIRPLGICLLLFSESNRVLFFLFFPCAFLRGAVED